MFLSVIIDNLSSSSHKTEEWLILHYLLLLQWRFSFMGRLTFFHRKKKNCVLNCIKMIKT
jgi:hypothetical protein